MRQADIEKGGFYLGGNRQRIREVLEAHEIWVEWRDIDPETVDFVQWLGVKNGRCTPKSFASWAKRRVTPDEVRARLALSKQERAQLCRPYQR